MSEDNPALRELFTAAGFAFVDLPVLYEASVFVEPLGEDLRRRLFLTTDANGTEMALRPDFTIPVALHHLAGGATRRKAAYAYLGPIFRQRSDGPDEFLQAGVESLGRGDRDQADADILRLAIDAGAALGLSKPVMRIGDSGLFAAVLDVLDLDPPWRRRLGHAFGDPKRLRALLCRKAGNGDGVIDPAFAGLSPARVRRKVEEMFAAAGLGVTGRTPAEVATRYAEKAVLAAGVDARASGVLTRFLDINGAPAAAATALAALARDEKLAIGPALDRFNARLDAFSDRGIAVERLAFATEFGRRLDYYTGFMFEILLNAKATKPVIGGGRYDRLVSMLARLRHETAVTVPAVGFSIWLDRIGGQKP